MADLPTGTVTFLFTDIEGSTRLLTRLGDRFRDVMAEHRRLLRAAFGRHGGWEVGTEGDSFFVAFARAPDALAAAVAAQRALAAAPWTDGVEVRVRMGIHTGAATVQDGDYVGIDVHRAARIASAAHGGQVLVSSSTHALVAPSGVAFRDIGEHRLKDLDRPEHLFQVVTGDLRADFPSPATLSPVRARIPAPPTPTIGREADLARLGGVLTEPGNRLVTVVGPGGVGKTRVALELAGRMSDELPGGASFVALAPVSGQEHVASTIARELDVVPLPSESLEDALARHLGDREMLLVLDNFEHVLDAAPLVASLLSATTKLRILVTSREPLRLQAERLFRLEPLAVPALETNGNGAHIEGTAAVELFLAVARSRDAGFALDEQNAHAVARVCRRLDGLPLAIELAAARVGVLTVPELAARLRGGLEALGAGPRDAPARQRTLRATLEWSYGLLSPEERAALAGLAVFPGGCTVDAAQAVTGASLDVLDALVTKNLVVRRAVADQPGRLTLLDTIADFARERLAERGDVAELYQRHLDYYLAIATRAAHELERSDAPALVAELDLELHNMRAALSRALERRAAVPALQLATALRQYWELNERGREGAGSLQAALALSEEGVAPSIRAAALEALAHCLAAPDTFEDATAAARESLALARSVGDVAQCAASMLALADVALTVHHVEDAYRYAAEAERLAVEAGDETKRIQAQRTRSLVAPTLEEALTLGAKVAAEQRRAGSPRRAALLETSLTYTALYHGDLAAAQRVDAGALESAEASGDPRVLVYAYGNHGLVSLLLGDTAGAAAAFAGELRVADRKRYDHMLFEAIAGLAGVAAARGEDELAARLTGAADSTSSERHDPVIARWLDERCFAPSRARLGERAWRNACLAGAALTREQAVEAAAAAHASWDVGADP